MGLPRVSRRTIRAVRHFAEAVFSNHGQPPSSDRLNFTVSEYEETLAYGGFRSRLLVGFCLWVVGLLGCFFLGRIGSTWRLSLGDRVSALQKMEANPLFASPILAVKATLCIIYYDHPEAFGEVGYAYEGTPPPPESLAS